MVCWHPSSAAVRTLPPETSDSCRKGAWPSSTMSNPPSFSRQTDIDQTHYRVETERAAVPLVEVGLQSSSLSRRPSPEIANATAMPEFRSRQASTHGVSSRDVPHSEVAFLAPLIEIAPSVAMSTYGVSSASGLPLTARTQQR